MNIPANIPIRIKLPAKQQIVRTGNPRINGSGHHIRYAAGEGAVVGVEAEVVNSEVALEFLGKGFPQALRGGLQAVQCMLWDIVREAGGVRELVEGRLCQGMGRD